MRKKLKSIPRFKNEAQERAFWESPGNDSTEYFDPAKMVRATFPNLRPTTRSISLRLPGTLLERIRAQANKLDVPYQSLMKVWLTEKTDEATKRR